MGNAAAGGRGPEPWRGVRVTRVVSNGSAALPERPRRKLSAVRGEVSSGTPFGGKQSKSPPSFPRKVASNHVDAPRLGTVDSLCSVSGLPLTRVDCAGNRREPAVPICVRGLAATGRVQGALLPGLQEPHSRKALCTCLRVTGRVPMGTWTGGPPPAPAWGCGASGL